MKQLVKTGEISKQLANKGLKVTPQRVAVLETIKKLNNHPTAENIIEHIRQTHPNIATGTVYKVLDVLTDHRLINRVKTERGIMRYDAVMEKHHHLYSAESDRIEDYTDRKLDKMLEEYFLKKDIPGFAVENIRLQIIGKFMNE